jgi:hypothetical protein
MEKVTGSKHMSQGNDWLYFDVHGLVHMRVEAGHVSERSVRLVFGPFETDYLNNIDLTLQYQPPKLPEHSFAGEDYLFSEKHVFIKKYKLHLIDNNSSFTLASQRDLLPFIPPIIQTLLLRRRHCLLHCAAIAVEGRGILLPGWGGTGKTSAIICLLRETGGSAFMSDDYTVLSSDGRILSFPKAFFIYPYHRELFPHLFKAKHKLLIPPIFSGIVERVRTIVRPTIMAFPRLEDFARRFTPEHMQIPAQIALPGVQFCDNAALERILFIESYSGNDIIIDELDLSDVKRRLIGTWNYEQGRCARDLILGAGGTGIIDLDTHFSEMSSVILSALRGKKVHRLRIGRMKPTKVGQTVVDAVRKILP